MDALRIERGDRRLELYMPGRCSTQGVNLTKVPDALTGWVKPHVWQSPFRYWEQRVARDPQLESAQLDLRIVGRAVRWRVDQRLELLGDGDGPVRVVCTYRGSERWFEGYLESVSSIDWHGAPRSSVMADLSVRLAVPHATWRGAEVQKTFEGAEVPRVLEIGTWSTEPVWPTIEITGSYESLKLRLTPGTEWQELPHTGDGWLVETEPQHRRVTDRLGQSRPDIVVPFWPEPMEVSAGVAKLYVDVEGAGSDFRLAVSFTQESMRAW